MISNEQIAHELTMTYMNNRYDVTVSGSFSDGTGHIEVDRLPSTYATKNVKVGTGERGFLGFEKTKEVRDGYVVDNIFNEMVEEYCRAYSKFLKLLRDKQDR